LCPSANLLVRRRELRPYTWHDNSLRYNPKIYKYICIDF